MFKKIIALCSLLFALCAFGAAQAADLTGTASVNVTSDTAVTAKNMAMIEARRQITTDVLSQYSETDGFRELMKNAKDPQLSNLISSTGIDSEKLSATTYSANIKMTIDEVAAKKWLDSNGVQNWLGAGDDSSDMDKISATLELSNGMRDMIEMNRALRDAKINFVVTRISGSKMTISIPAKNRGAFIGAIRGAGWRTSESDGGLYISK